MGIPSRSVRNRGPKTAELVVERAAILLYAGIFFMLECVTELGHEAFPTLLTDLTGIAFLAGLGFMAIAVFESQRVMRFVITTGIPEYHPSRWGLEISIVTIVIMDAAIVVTYIINQGLRSAILTSSFEATLFFLFVISLLAGLGSGYRTYRGQYPNSKLAWFSTLYLLAAPYIGLVAAVVLSRFFG